MAGTGQADVTNKDEEYGADSGAGAKSVIAFLNKVTGKEFNMEIHGKPSPLVELLASRLAKGETTITTLKALISQVAQSCRSWEEREEKLKPSVLF